MKSSHTKRAFRAVLAAAVVSIGIMPIMAHAATPSVISLSVDNAPLTPYNSGDAKVRGYATPDVDVDLYASDTGLPGTFTKLDYANKKTPVHTHATAYGGDGAGFFDTLANLTGFGTHDGSTTTIYLGAIAFSGTDRSDMYGPVPVDKSSGTAGDVYKPALKILTTPPSTWCHVASTDSNGSCGSTSFKGRAPVIPQCRTQTVVVAVPQVGPVSQGPIPVNPPSPAPRATTPPVGPVGPVGPTAIATIPGQPIPQWPSQAPSQVKWFPCYAPLPNGHAAIAGDAFDNNSGSFGKASEIKDVVIRIKGGTVDRTYTTILRKNTGGFFNQSIIISDYPPGTYSLSIIAHDAFGMASDEFKKSFTVEPDGA